MLSLAICKVGFGSFSRKDGREAQRVRADRLRLGAKHRPLGQRRKDAKEI